MSTPSSTSTRLRIRTWRSEGVRRSTARRDVRRRAGATALVMVALGSATVALWTHGLPQTDILATEDPRVTSYMVLRRESGTATRQHGIDRPWVPLAAIAPVLACAVVKAEDRRFFLHSGVEWQPTLLATARYLSGRDGGGGSTITQQLARNLYLGPARTPMRKLREIVIAKRLEASLSKPRILELYLNVVEWSRAVWGIHAAAKFYFGVEPSHLDAFQASFLAAMLAAPRQTPVAKNGERVHAVQTRVLRQLTVSRIISSSEATAALDASDQWFSGVGRGESWHRAVQRSSMRYNYVVGARRNSDRTSASPIGRTCGFEEEIQQEKP